MVNMLKVMVAASILALIIGVALLGARLFRAFCFSNTKSRDESHWLELVSLLIVVGLAIGDYATNRYEATGWMGLGVVFFIAGWVLQFYSRKQLGEYKTFEDKATQSFRDARQGIYDRIRHPSKTALIVILLGMIIAFNSVWSLGLFVIFYLPSLLYRIHQEERTLCDQFGQRYITYQSETKRLIPGIL